MNPFHSRTDLFTKAILSTLLLLVCLAWSFTGFAQEEPALLDTTEPESQNEPATDESLPKIIPEPEPDPEILNQARIDRDRYNEVIANLEDITPQNIYNPELTEAYLNLAGTLEKLGELEEAATVFDQALQTVRISNGLNSLEQLPILERQLDNNMTRQEWSNVDDLSYLIFHIARRNYPVGDARRVQALDRLGKWKIQSLNQNLVNNFDSGMREIVSMYKNELSLMETSGEFEGKGVQLATLHLGHAWGVMEIAKQINNRPLSDYRTTSQQTITQQRCRLIQIGNGRVQQVCETVEVPNMDFYLDPSIRKAQEINLYLGQIRKSITRAFEALQVDGDPTQREALMIETKDITEAYNVFVTSNNL